LLSPLFLTRLAGLLPPLSSVLRARHCFGRACLPSALLVLGLAGPVDLIGRVPAATAAEAGPSGAGFDADLSRFSDLRPQDWAYQALMTLRERHGCGSGRPDGRFDGQVAISRDEAAALLESCLSRVDTVTDQLQRLLAELQPELAALRGRVDGLEARIGSLEASTFSTTTRLSGLATMVVGANGFGGNDAELLRSFRSLEAGTTINFDLRLDLDTSFSGKDLLHLQLRAGNFAASGFGDGVLPNELEVAFELDCGLPSDCGDVLAVERLFYQFPIGESLTLTAGPKVRQDDMLGLLPSLYPGDTILDVLTYAGAPGTYNSNLGAGAGLVLRSGNLSFSAQMISTNADASVTRKHEGCRLASETTPDCGGGLANASSATTSTLQLAYGDDSFGLAVAYTASSRFWGDLYGGDATALAAELALLENTSSWAISGYWQPATAGWLPSISVGWGINLGQGSPVVADWGGVQSQSWFVGLQWDDVLAKGNSIGLAVGQPTFVTHLPGAITLEDGRRIGPGTDDGSYVWECWLRSQISDQISVTPAIYYLSAPLGQLQKGEGRSFDNLGALIKTSFRF